MDTTAANDALEAPSPANNQVCPVEVVEEVEPAESAQVSEIGLEEKEEEKDEHKAGNSSNTMKAQLQALQDEDADCIFIARRINKLGFDSPEQLRLYFATFGDVKSVHVSHSRVRSRGDAVENWRQRPAALGFVVMATSEATAAILKDGVEHTVNGTQVAVQAFRRNAKGDKSDAEPAEPTPRAGSPKRRRVSAPAVDDTELDERGNSRPCWLRGEPWTPVYGGYASRVVVPTPQPLPAYPPPLGYPVRLGH